MSDIPPRQPVNGTASARVESAYGLPPLPPADLPPDIDATGALVSLHQAATHSGPDSFPVLKAFQDYLESERRRARRRVALVTSLFAGLTLVLVAAFLAAGVLLFNYMKDREERLWLRLEQQPAPAAAAPSPAAPALPATAVAALEQELRTLGAALAELKNDNAARRGTFATPPPAPAVRAPDAADARPAAEPAPPPPPSAGAVAPPAADPVAAGPRPAALEIPAGVKPPAPPAGYAESDIYLRPGGKGAPIPWRVYVPAP